MNSSSAASMMASRRSAARSARLDGGLGVEALDDAGFGGLVEAAFSPRRRLVGLEGVPSLAVVRKLAMGVT
jgi:hypothetical protein